MARRFRRKRKRKRTMVRRRRRRKFNPYSVLGLPKTYRCSMIFAIRVKMNPGASGIAADFVIRANGAFDPEAASGTGQPRFWDQVSSLYQLYTVVGSKCEVHAANTDVTTSQIVGIYTNKLSTSITNIHDLVQTRGRGVSYKVAAPQGSGKNVVRMISTWSLNREGGRNQSRNANFQASVTQVPVFEWFYHIMAAPVDFAENPDDVDVLITVTYRLIFWRSLLPPESAG